MLILRLLGPLDIRVGERRLRHNGRDKGLALLAYLAATAECAHSREDVADLFWPDFPHERARQNLRQTLLRLRRLLADGDAGRPCLPNQNFSPLFDSRADYWLDLKAFVATPAGDESIERLQQRAALYRGDFLADLVGEISERFDSWVTERRAEYRNLALVVESRLVVRLEQTGQIDQAIEHARRCARLEPWNESIQRRLLRLLARAGHPEAALGHFGAWREELRRELDTDAEPETLALIEDIRRSGPGASALAPESPPTERRQVTVLDCGLSCDDDDPERIALRLAEPLRRTHDLLQRHGGRVTTTQPGRITAWFGWPDIDERAAAHAAHAALTVLARLAREHPEVKPDIGIDHGPMLVSQDESGGWLAAERALRLRLRAPPGAALVGDALAASLAERFHIIRQAGPDSRYDAWRLLGERGPFPLDRPESIPLTGRAMEIDRITRYWQQIPAAGRRVLAVTGPAGIGKSRLAREFLRASGVDETRACWCECDALHVDSPLFPLQRMLQRRLGLTPESDAVTVHARLRALLPDDTSGAMARRLVPLFCSRGDDADSAAGSREPLSGALAHLLARVLCAGAPGAVLVVDDAHWADASTLEVLNRLAQRAGENILILALARERPLLERFEWLTLGPLDARESAELARQAAGAENPGVTAAAAEGIPLFIIELARMRARLDPGDDTVPANLRDLLCARLDQAGPDRALLQAAAVIGRTFEIRALRSLTDEPGGPLEPALERLIALDLLERTAGGLRFTHALLQRSAYDSLPRGQRIAFHRRRAEQIQADAPETTSAPEEVAWHLSAAGLDAGAAQWWLRAAQRASRLSAYLETVQFAGRALTAVEAAPERNELADTELTALLVGAHAHVALGGYFDSDARILHERAHRLLNDQQADPLRAFGILRGYWFGASSRASHREARSIAEEMARIADTTGADSLRGIAHYLIGNSALWLGRFVDALTHLEQATAFLQRTSDPVTLLAHEQDFEVTTIGYLGWAHWYLGRTDTALELGRRALELARARGQPLTLLHAAASFCAVCMGSGLAQEVAQVAAQTIRIAQANNLAMWVDIGVLHQCWAQGELGRRVDSADASRALERVCTVYPGGASGFQAMAVEIHLAQGEYRQASAALAMLRRSIQSTKAGMFAVVRFLLESRLARQQGDLARAAAAGRRALAVARAQESPQLETMAREALRALD